MNIAMEQTEEYVNGQLKNKYGDAFIRGNNGDEFKNLAILLIFKLNDLPGENVLLLTGNIIIHNVMQCCTLAPRRGLSRMGPSIFCQDSVHGFW